MKLKSPHNFGGANVRGVVIVGAEDGSAEVPDHLVTELIETHGFSPWFDPPQVKVVEVPVEKIVEKEVESDADGLPANPDAFDEMSRAALFRFIADNGGGAIPKHKTPELRAMARDIKAKAVAELKTPEAPPFPAAPAPGADLPNALREVAEHADEFDRMDRAGLVAWLAAKGVTETSTAQDGELRAACRRLDAAIHPVA